MGKISKEDSPTRPDRIALICEMRQDGFTLEEIGNTFELSAERIRQLLNKTSYTIDEREMKIKRYARRRGNLKLVNHEYVKALIDESHSRLEFAQKLGYSHTGDDLNKAIERFLQLHNLEMPSKYAAEKVKLKCVECGKVVERYKSDIGRREYDGDCGPFCSEECHGRWLARNHGFKANPQNRAWQLQGD